VEETGLTFREFVRTERVKMLAQRYDIRSDLYAQILIEKFTRYFEEGF
jgi:hypothetical protein